MLNSAAKASDLPGAEFRPARFRQVPERHVFEAMAGRASLAENEEATLQLLAIEGAERPGEAPVLKRGFQIFTGCMSRAARHGEGAATNAPARRRVFFIVHEP